MKRILILGAGEMQVPIIKRAKERGLFVIAADYDNKAPGLSIADESAIVSTNDYENILKIADEKSINGILTTSDYPVRVVAKIAIALNLFSMSEEVAIICTDKYLQRVFFLNNGIKTPAFKLVRTESDLVEIKSFPCIIKPVDSSASRGVKKIYNEEQLFEQFDETLKFSNKGEVIIEDFVDGQEFSVETFTQDGITTIIAITEKITIGEENGFFVEGAHIVPARIDDAQSKIIEKEVSNAIRLLGVNNCPTHTEVKLNKKGAFIIEIACRLGGDFIASDLVPLATGVDMLDNLINVTLGDKLQVQPKFSKIAAISFLSAENYESSKKIIESKNKSIKKYEVQNYHNRSIKNSMDRMGYIIF